MNIGLLEIKIDDTDDYSGGIPTRYCFFEKRDNREYILFSFPEINWGKGVDELLHCVDLVRDL